MNKILLLRKVGNPHVVDLLGHAGPIESGWELDWESPPLPIGAITEIREWLLSQWPDEHLGHGRFALDPSLVRSAILEWVKGHGHPPAAEPATRFPDWYPRAELVDPGTVYVLGNDSMPGTLKIGRTSGSAEDRARSLSTTGVPRPFVVLWVSGLIERHSTAERQIHEELASTRVSATREFFEVGLPEAVAVCEVVVERFAPRPQVEDLLKAFLTLLGEELQAGELQADDARRLLQGFLRLDRVPDKMKAYGGFIEDRLKALDTETRILDRSSR